MFPYQFVFEPLAPDVELHSSRARTGAGTWTRTGATGAEVAAASSAAWTVGAAAVLRPADLIHSDTAKASAPQGKPPTAGVIPSHDHCSHTRITVTVEEKVRKRRRVGGGKGHGKSKGKTLTLVIITSGNKRLILFEHDLSPRSLGGLHTKYHLDHKNIPTIHSTSNTSLQHIFWTEAKTSWTTVYVAYTKKCLPLITETVWACHSLICPASVS